MAITTKIWDPTGIKIVKISTTEHPQEFCEWLYGQTLPMVDDDPEPTGWAYYWDYERFINNYPVIDQLLTKMKKCGRIRQWRDENLFYFRRFYVQQFF